MKAVYKKEAKGYLTSMIGYVFIFFILLVYGIYFSYVNIDKSLLLQPGASHSSVHK